MEEYIGLLWSACSLYLKNPEDIRECIQDASENAPSELKEQDSKMIRMKYYNEMACT